MGRLWLAVALVVALGASARADDVVSHPSEHIVRERNVKDTLAPGDATDRPRGEANVGFPRETGATGMLVFGLTVVGGFTVGVVAIVLLRRYRRPTVERPSAQISLLVAEHAARATRRRAGMFAILGLGGLAAIVGAGIPIFPWIFGLWSVPAIRGLWIANAALRLIEVHGATAETTGSTIVVRGNDRSVRLHLTPPELAAAKRRSVPAASVQA